MTDADIRLDRPSRPSNPVVRAFFQAVNTGDRTALLALLTTDAVLVVDGGEREVEPWLDREVLDPGGHVEVVDEEVGGLVVSGRFRAGEGAEPVTGRWAFELREDRVSRVEIGGSRESGA
ncbi:nuclear transport factor 2 family protein [Streptomyces sp. ST2-7A]|uniref:nuclear transport factor 2 family protein n=1 Tax=Streptomyces sp. ST2-7A TaxID=2907214 RepID=UPI001F3E1617|nr:nuclear transport factor 2 family protein [Streptomyces sp. ST2-7A]MCE7082390.1 nuclear transport factor 2 family protein [Streptomyces sp. ST2-7A]